jgi:hypothetical protein
MSLLTITNKIQKRLTLSVSSAVYASTDPQTMLILECIQEGGRALATRAEWQILRGEHTFTTVAAASQTTSSLPSDLDWIIPETIWNRTRKRRVYGPISAAEWQLIQATTQLTVDPAFTIRGGAIYITPTPDAGDTVAYEYLSTKWCESNLGVAQAEFAADTDVARIDEELHVLDGIWRFKQKKGLDYLGDQTIFERRVAEKLMRDGVKPRISLSEVAYDRIPVAPQVPDTLTFT